MKHADLPNSFRLEYHNQRRCSLIRLGAIKPTNNPYFAVQERQVQNGIVRRLGAKPLTEYQRICVIRADGTMWDIVLDNFAEYEYIDELED